MNLLFVALYMYPDYSGGAEIFNYFLANWSKPRFKMKILTVKAKGAKSDEDAITLNCTKIIPNFISIPLKISHYIFKLRKEIDVIYVSYAFGHCFYWLPYVFAKVFLGIPYIVTSHDGSLRSWAPEPLYKAFFRLASSVIAVSEPMRQEYAKRLNRQIELIYPVVPFQKCFQSPQELKTQNGFISVDMILLCVGDMNSIKRPDVLLEAFMALPSDFVLTKNLHLIFAGEGPLCELMQSKITGVAWRQRVHFLGVIPHEKISMYFKMADIYIHPSQFEGTSLALMEAMFNGLPIIANNTPGIRAMIDDKITGILFEGGAVDLKEKIIALASDETLRRSLGICAENNFLKRFSTFEIASQYFDIIERFQERR